MKLWVISSSYPTHPLESINAGVLSRDLALSLRDDGHQVTVITPDKPEATTFDAGVQGRTIPWYRPTVATADLNLRNPIDGVRATSLMLNGLRLVRHEARVNPPDGIVAVWGLPSGVWARAAAAVARVPYGVWLLGSDVWRAPEFPGGVRILRAVIKDSVTTFANSRDLAERARRLTGLKVDYLPAARKLPQGQALPDGAPLVFVGRLHHNKGPDLLVEALRLAAVSGVRPATAIFGSGEMNHRLQAMINAFGLATSVSLEGPVGSGRLADVLRSAKCLVIPSRIDSTPLVLGDAIQAQTRVLATDVGDTGAIVRRFGLGRVVPPGDVGALAMGIREVMTVPSRTAPDWENAAGLMSSLAPPTVFVEMIGQR